MIWEKYLEMVKDNGMTKAMPCELTIRILRKFWKKYHNKPLELSVYSAILVTALIRCEVW